MASIDDRLDLPLTDFDNQVHSGGSDDTLMGRTNEDTAYTLYEGMAVSGTGQTAGNIVRMDGSDILNRVMGIVRRPHATGKDVDQPIAHDKPVNVFPIDGASKVWVPIAIAAGPIPIIDGDVIIAEKSGTYPGYGQKLTDALITGSTNYPKLLQKI